MPTRERPLVLSLFEMGAFVHLAPGMWRHPDDQRHRILGLDYWRELGQLLEHGTFDQLFLADVIGAYDGFGDGLETPLREGYQIPALDPLTLLGAVADSTQHLGLAATFSTTYEPPFSFARRIATLDHLSQGRVAWNVVTSYLQNAAQNFGLPDQIDHDERYRIAEEYLDVVYKLLLGSWDQDAVRADVRTGVYADPSKVHYVDHDGEHFRVRGPHLLSPSPQRLPVLFQAGSSLSGLAFAATHAEVVFVGGQSIKRVGENVAEIRRLAAQSGRDPDHLAFLASARIVVARTTDEAHEKAALYERYASTPNAIDHSRRGPDLTRYSPDDLVEHVIAREDDGYRMLIREWRPGQTVRDLLGARANATRGGGPFTIVGSPEEVADALERWAEEAGLDGFNISQRVSFESLHDFVDLVMPVLRRRGIARASYADGETLRERLLGGGPLPHPTHPAMRHVGGIDHNPAVSFEHLLGGQDARPFR